MIPDYLRDTVDACAALAAELGREYDSWEAGPVGVESGDSGAPSRRAQWLALTVVRVQALATLDQLF